MAGDSIGQGHFFIRLNQLSDAVLCLVLMVLLLGAYGIFREQWLSGLIIGNAGVLWALMRAHARDSKGIVGDQRSAVSDGGLSDAD